MSGINNKNYFQTYKSSYASEFPCIEKSKLSENAFCTKCSVNFSLGHAGKGDISKHLSTQKHKKNVSGHRENSKINTFFDSNVNNVIRAECLFTAFIVEHNLPINCADHIGPLLKKMFPGNALQKKLELNFVHLSQMKYLY